MLINEDYECDYGDGKVRTAEKKIAQVQKMWYNYRKGQV